MSIELRHKPFTGGTKLRMCRYGLVRLDELAAKLGVPIWLIVEIVRQNLAGRFILVNITRDSDGFFNHFLIGAVSSHSQKMCGHVSDERMHARITPTMNDGYIGGGGNHHHVR